MDAAQWQELAGGVTPEAAAWGSKWVRLIDLEESAGRARRAELWALTGAALACFLNPGPWTLCIPALSVSL